MALGIAAFRVTKQWLCGQDLDCTGYATVVVYASSHPVENETNPECRADERSSTLFDNDGLGR